MSCTFTPGGWWPRSSAVAVVAATLIAAARADAIDSLDPEH